MVAVIGIGRIAMWYDAKIDTLTTSPLNIPRMLVSESISIDSLFLSGPEVVVFQDDRYPPAVPYPSYLIQNLTTGMLRTVLPGGTIRKTKE